MNHPDYPSVLQALEIEDPVVANCLIDQRAIECILLIKVSSLENHILEDATYSCAFFGNVFFFYCFRFFGFLDLVV